MSVEITRLLSSHPRFQEILEWLTQAYFQGVVSEQEVYPKETRKKIDVSAEPLLKSSLETILKNTQENALFLALIDNQPIGYALGLTKHNIAEIPAQSGFVNGVYVVASHRRNSIASQLVASLMSWFKAQGLTHVELSVAQLNKAGIGFWKKLGFIESEIQFSKIIK